MQATISKSGIAMYANIAATFTHATPLSSFVLDGVEDMKEVIGHGAYAEVKKLKFRGLECVGKKMHDILYQNATPQQREDMLTRFKGECELLSRLHHPCIVQFMGVHLEEGTPLPVLVMERLHSTVAAAIDRYGVLPDQISYGILCDVSLGLRYLHEHSPPIIHRDLSANNVLLTPHMSAKISDLGVAKMLNVNPFQKTQLQVQTKVPGTPCYMPPEALTSRPKYDTKIDIYSMGVMLIHVFCGEWPHPTDVFQPDPANPNRMIPVTEKDRRIEFLLKIGDNHPLIPLIHKCLSNGASSRPTAAQIYSNLREIEKGIPAVLPETRILMYKQLRLIQSEAGGVKKALNERIQDVRREKDQEIKVLMNRVMELSIKCDNSSSEEASEKQLHPQSRILWTRHSDIPIKCSRMHSVVIGENVYVGGGVAENDKDECLVFKFNVTKNTWTYLPNHSVFYFGLCQFEGKLVSIGGVDIQDGQPTSKVYFFNTISRKWVEFLEPMLTKRAYPALVSNESGIVACGGRTSSHHSKQQLSKTLASVEVYCAKTSMWYMSARLPQPCALMSTVIVNGTAFLFGGSDSFDLPTKYPFSANLEMLVAGSLPTDNYLYTNTFSWKTLPDDTLGNSAAASLCGQLLSIGGYDGRAQSSVYMYTMPDNSWVKLTFGDLPTALYATTAVQLTNNRLMVVGGKSKDFNDTSVVYIGTIVKPDDDRLKTYTDDSFSDEDTYLSLMPTSVPKWAPSNYIEKVKVLYNYESSEPDELTITTGAIIYVVSKSNPGSGWDLGVLNGVTGHFPSNYVKTITDN